MQDLNDLLYFAEVVDRGGFAAAGRALGIPKSRLSRRVAELEARLGVRLLQRTTRKLALTRVGEQFHRHCVAMREDARAAEEAVAQIRSEPRGMIRVACPVTLAQTTIGPLVPRFLQLHPQVRLDMRVSNRPVDLIEEGFDVALRVRTAVADTPNLVMRSFGMSRTLLVASPLQLARQGNPTTLDELAAMDLLAMTAVEGRASWLLVGDQGERTLPFQARYIADDLIALKLAAVGGVGVAALPDYMCRQELQEGTLMRVLPGWAPPPAVFHAVYPTRRGLVPAVRVFIDFLVENIPLAGEY